jgi:hypothetical protein
MSKSKPKQPKPAEPRPPLPGPYPPYFSPDDDELPTRTPPSPSHPKG